MEGEINTQSQHKGQGALDAFLNLFNLITLGWMAISLGQVLFWIINKFFSIESINMNSSQTGLKFGIASLIIIVPIFLVVAGYLHKHYKNGRLDPQSGIYRWLTYLMLLISALSIIGSLITIVFRLLEGDYTLAAILKITTVFIIALGIFGYYWYDLRRSDYSKRSIVSIVAVGLITLIVLATVIGSFLLVDSPKTSQIKKYDEGRANNLATLNSMIISYYQNNSTLPEDLSDNKFSSIVDPETDVPYDYEVTGEESYKLCATFSLKANMSDRYYEPIDDWYYHDAGYQCFDRSIQQYKEKLIPERVIR